MEDHPLQLADQGAPYDNPDKTALLQHHYTGGGTSYVDGPSASPASPPSSGVAGDSGSDFVNFDQYWNANQGVAERNANAVGSGVEGAATGAVGALGDLSNTFGADVSQGTGKGPVAGSVVQTAMGGNVLTVPANGTSTTTTSQTTPTTPAPRTGPNKTSSLDKNSPATPRPPAPDVPPPATLTRGDLLTGSQQQYTGPTDIRNASGYDALTGKITDASSQVSALGSKDGLGALLAKNYGSSPVGSGGNELDSILTNRAGRSRFDDIGRNYGDLDTRLEKAGTDSDALVKKAQGDTETAAGTYKSLLDQFDEKAPKTAAETGAAPAPTAPTGPVSGKSFKDYNTGNEAAHTVRDIGRVLNPIGWLMNAAGMKSPEDVMTPQYEEQFGHPIGNASAVQFDRRMPGSTPEQQEKVYNSLSTEEIASLEKMSFGEQTKFLSKRLNSLLGVK
jgi:hypothetical protein